MALKFMIFIKLKSIDMTEFFPCFGLFETWTYKTQNPVGFTPREGSTPSFGTTRNHYISSGFGFFIAFIFWFIILYKIASAPKWHQLCFSKA
jgi:hypothetical protein